MASVTLGRKGQDHQMDKIHSYTSSVIISTYKQLFLLANLESEDFSNYAVILPSSDYSHVPALL